MKQDIGALKQKAKWLRLKVLESVVSAKMGHIGGTYSCVEIFIALYYGKILNFDPKDPGWKARARFVVGKGQCCLAMYHILADLGVIPLNEVLDFGKNGSPLGGHMDIHTPGIEYNTGSLGHAIGIASGMALASKMSGKNSRAFALSGDGECAEGSVWESASFAARNGLNNLICIVDRNRLGGTATVEDEDESAGIKEKFEANGWETRHINGHDFDELISALTLPSAKPVAVIAETVKGKGVSFMENNIRWHHGAPTEEETKIARKELEMRQ